MSMNNERKKFRRYGWKFDRIGSIVHKGERYETITPEYRYLALQRETQGYTVEEVCDKVGIKPDVLQRLESGTLNFNTFPFQKALLLCAVLKVDPKYFIRHEVIG